MNDSEAYILNAVQTPGPLYPVYKSVADGAETKTEITEDTGIKSGLDELLQSLRLLRLVGEKEDSYYADEYVWDIGDDRLNFKLSALHNLAQEKNRDGWGKQAVVLLNYQYLLQHDIQRFDNNESSLYESIDEWLLNDRNYEPKSDKGRITHNDNKFANWTRLIHFLGLVHKVSGREHTVYPTADILNSSLILAANESGLTVDGSPAVGIEEYLNWLSENLLFVTTTSDGNVPKPLARALFELVESGAIEFVEYGDAGTVGLDSVPTSYDGVEKQANTIMTHYNEF
jgi:hypothetical protein